MAKADIKQAYRNMLVHPDDRDLLGMQWQGQLLVDGCLPFGLRSAPPAVYGGGRPPAVGNVPKRSDLDQALY